MEKMKCPECGRRIFDIDTKATDEVRIEAKCPHCKKVVMICWKPQGKQWLSDIENPPKFSMPDDGDIIVL